MRHESAYLLRIWNDGNSPNTWRASLEDVRKKDIIRFASLEDLNTYLNKQSVPQAEPKSPSK